MAPETPSDYTARRFSLDVWKKFVREAAPYKKHIIALIACAIALAVIDSMFTLMIRWVINDLQADAGAALWPHACVYLVLAIIFASIIKFAYINSAG
jgi:ABC-type multidrug transport system fused ATPase/permease subunit